MPDRSSTHLDETLGLPAPWRLHFGDSLVPARIAFRLVGPKDGPVVAVLGDQTGYFIGRRIGPALFKKEDSRFFKQHHVTESHAFFEKYGPMAIIMARFMPFVRTFTPVVAGVSYMRYPVFLGFDIVGGIAWGAGATLLGYFLGNNEFVHNNLEKIILAILFVSMIPAFISVGRVYLNRRRERSNGDLEVAAGLGPDVGDAHPGV